MQRAGACRREDLGGFWRPERVCFHSCPTKALAVSLLDWLFSRKLSPGTPQSEKRRTQSTPLREPERPVGIYPSEKRPFDTIADAQAAWQAIDFAGAEK